MRSELEIGRQLAFVLELIARGEALRVTVSKADSVTCNGPWHKEGVRVTGEGVGDHLPDGLDHLVLSRAQPGIRSNEQRSSVRNCALPEPS